MGVGVSSQSTAPIHILILRTAVLGRWSAEVATIVTAISGLHS